MNAVSKSAVVRIPSALNERLEALSEKTGRAKTYYARKALEQYLEDMEDRLLVAAALEEGRGKGTTSLEDIIKEFGLEGEVQRAGKTRIQKTRS